MNDQRRPGMLVWHESGRQYVAHIGKLSLTVRRLGSAARGDLRWHVGSVFGVPFLSSEWHADLTDAILEAERLAFAEARAFVRALRRWLPEAKATPSGERTPPPPARVQGEGPCLCEHADDPRRAHRMDCPARKLKPGRSAQGRGEAERGADA